MSLIERRAGSRLAAETAAAYCRVFGVDFEWLVNGNGKAPEEEAIRKSAGAAESPPPPSDPLDVPLTDSTADNTIPTPPSFDVIEGEESNDAA